jgi:hypothetical protein
MKNLILSFVIVLATGVAPALAHAANNDPRVEKAFTQQFAGAENVKWTTLDDGYQKANFTISGIRVEAIFSKEAEFLGAVRNLFYNQLPLAVMQTIGNKFANAVILEVTEITNNESTSYNVVLEQKNKKYTLKLNSQGEITEKENEKIKK